MIKGQYSEEEDFLLLLSCRHLNFGDLTVGEFIELVDETRTYGIATVYRFAAKVDAYIINLNILLRQGDEIHYKHVDGQWHWYIGDVVAF